MGRIKPQVRSGFLDLFYAIFEKNFGQRGEGAEQDGRARGHRIRPHRGEAHRGFFLGSFDERVENQEKQHKENKEEYEAEFKQRTKEEKKARRKQILSNIGEDLLVVSKDQPFRFPAELTFVVRAFSVLDGIGKSLNKKFDIGEISAPYARNLLIEDNPSSLPPQVVARQRFQRRFDRQNKAIVNLFGVPTPSMISPRRCAPLSAASSRSASDALEAERAIERVAAMQQVMLKAMVALSAVNVGVVLYVSGLVLQAKIGFGLSAAFGHPSDAAPAGSSLSW